MEERLAMQAHGEKTRLETIFGKKLFKSQNEKKVGTKKYSAFFDHFCIIIIIVIIIIVLIIILMKFPMQI